MTTIREYAIILLFALAAILVAGYYFQHLLTTLVQHTFNTLP